MKKRKKTMDCLNIFYKAQSIYSGSKNFHGGHATLNKTTYQQMGRIAKQCVILGGGHPFTVSEHRIRKRRIENKTKKIPLSAYYVSSGSVVKCQRHLPVFLPIEMVKRTTQIFFSIQKYHINLQPTSTYIYYNLTEILATYAITVS